MGEKAHRQSHKPTPAETPRDFDESGLSLEDLSAAYSQLIERGDNPYEPVPAAEQPLPAEEPPSDACEVTPRTILEAMLFVGHPQNEPLTSQQVAALMRGVRPQEIDALVDELNASYEAEGCPYHIVSQGNGYVLQLRDEFSGLRENFYGRVREAKLSQAAIDVLALVAYRQPMTSEEVSQVRGQASGGILSQLVRRQLLRIERPTEKPRTPRFYTTDRFLTLFGLTSLAELPQSQEVDKTWG